MYSLLGGLLLSSKLMFFALVLNLGSLLGEQDRSLAGAVQTLGNLEHQFPAWKDFLGTTVPGVRLSSTAQCHPSSNCFVTSFASIVLAQSCVWTHWNEDLV